MIEPKLKQGEGLYLDENCDPYWVVRADIGSYLIEDQNGNQQVISADHPALSNRWLRELAKLDRFSKH